MGMELLVVSAIFLVHKCVLYSKHEVYLSLLVHVFVFYIKHNCLSFSVMFLCPLIRLLLTLILQISTLCVSIKQRTSYSDITQL